ncbi:MAG: hypothetical protein HY898_22890 [Deltaproteobacteria bacterium]|nr:hypothetical protein [Deltaproteobacteria bacterium]
MNDREAWVRFACAAMVAHPGHTTVHVGKMADALLKEANGRDFAAARSPKPWDGEVEQLAGHSEQVVAFIREHAGCSVEFIRAHLRIRRDHVLAGIIMAEDDGRIVSTVGERGSRTWTVAPEASGS